MRTSIQHFSESVFLRLLRMRSAVFVLLMSMNILIVGCNSDSLKIVNNGETVYVIEVGEDLNQDGNELAEALQEAIEDVTGVRIPINNHIKLKGGNIRLNLNDESSQNVSIKTDIDRNVLISGGSIEALENAVNIFLEEYVGIKWYSPDVTVIPSLSVLEVEKELDYSYTPKIGVRTVHSRLFYENPEFAAKHKVTTEAFPFYVPGARVHTFHRFIPEESYYKEHPEYFALRGDKRLPTQLCLSNSDVTKLVIEAVRDYFEQYPESEVISVSQDDNQQFCQCTNCAKSDEEEGSPAGTMIRFVNEVAKEFPDKQISTLAYQYTRKPGKTKPLDNVLITLCSIECDRSAPITEKCVAFADDLRGWKELTSNIRIWDYTTQFTNFLAPFPNITTLQPNIQFFADNNATWIFEQHSNNPSELFELRSYVTAKLLWDPSLEMDALITEFTNGYYEEAGPFIKTYVDKIHEEIKKYPEFFLFLYGDPSQAFDSFLNVDLLNYYQELFDKAEKAVASKPAILNRVRVARISTDYAILEACKKNLSEKFSLVKKNGETNEMNPFVIKKLSNFEKHCELGNIEKMNEMNYSVQEYIDNYKGVLEVALKPNIAKGKPVKLITNPKKYANEDPQTLTDGSLGGNSFYANWLGFEGNHMEAIIDLEKDEAISSISTAFLQVTNHVVFYPLEVSYYYSTDGVAFTLLETIKNKRELTKSSKVNEIQYFNSEFQEVKARYVKVFARNMLTPPYWHHAAGLPSWIFADEVIID